jgi:hypothetical protein
MRESPLDEGRRWLEQAQADLRWAKHLDAQEVVSQIESWFAAAGGGL